MKALVVVDYQNDFVDGALGFVGAEALEPVIVGKIAECRRNGGRVIFTLDTHGEDYLESAEGRKLPVRHCIKGTEGHKLYGGLAECVRDGDVVIEKPSFGSLELAELLKREGFDEVELCGLVTDICVVSNAIIAKAALPESRIVVDGGACASFDGEKHKAALEVMRSVQIDVI
ncbi:MAG: cysteine hydrolase [Lachnospiraceae bacterium]|nr:cysteine hydrolase [Ruminococcus sp.]MCM1274231.1 cysteine hydrolase [Lachnospiraceae bacterium]